MKCVDELCHFLSLLWYNLILNVTRHLSKEYFLTMTSTLDDSQNNLSSNSVKRKVLGVHRRSLRKNVDRCRVTEMETTRYIVWLSSVLWRVVSSAKIRQVVAKLHGLSAYSWLRMRHAKPRPTGLTSHYTICQGKFRVWRNEMFESVRASSTCSDEISFLFRQNSKSNVNIRWNDFLKIIIEIT